MAAESLDNTHAAAFRATPAAMTGGLNYMGGKVLIAGTDSDLTRIVYHHLVQRFPGMKAIIEEPLPRRTLLRYRFEKLGLRAVVSQLMFIVLVRPFLRLEARERIARICNNYRLDRSAIPEAAVTRVSSINAPETVAALEANEAKVVVVSGTRIIVRKVLEAGKRTFLNIHTGITPAYRGSHGGYWALYQNDPGHFGVTLHVVDAGIDTGGIVEQEVVRPTAQDNFVSYPYLQVAAALPALSAAVEQALRGQLDVSPAEGSSGVWYHPGFFQYLGSRIRGVS